MFPVPAEGAINNQGKCKPLWKAKGGISLVSFAYNNYFRDIRLFHNWAERETQLC